jgi:hypothetical protein
MLTVNYEVILMKQNDRVLVAYLRIFGDLCLPHMLLLPPSGITLHSVFGESQTFQILTKHIRKTINNYETKYMQYENIFYDNSNDGYFIL